MQKIFKLAAAAGRRCPAGN